MLGPLPSVAVQVPASRNTRCGVWIFLVMPLPSFFWAVSILAAGVQGNVQPAFDLITRNFGNDAADHFELALAAGTHDPTVTGWLLLVLGIGT